jgi:hypothetical protein
LKSAECSDDFRKFSTGKLPGKQPHKNALAMFMWRMLFHISPEIAARSSFSVYRRQIDG